MIEAVFLLLKNYWFALAYAILWFVVSMVISWYTYRQRDFSNYPDDIDELSPTETSRMRNTDRPSP